MKEEKGILRNLREIKIENRVFGAEVLEVADLATGDGSEEAREGEEEAILAVGLPENVCAVVLRHSLRWAQHREGLRWGLRENALRECKFIASLPLFCFWIRLRHHLLRLLLAASSHSLFV